MKEPKHARILVIDDDPTVRESHEAVLNGDGYLVEIAENDKEAVAKSATQEPTCRQRSKVLTHDF